MAMLILSFFSWWYGAGWWSVIDSFKPRVTGVQESFSVGQLLRTLFAPWRRIITYPGSDLGQRFRAWGDNVFSRAIGFVVRLFVLLIALVALVLVAALTAIEVVVWLLLPIAIPGCIVAGLVI
ncbi:MAG TPA: hypothetical protein VK712_03290 [Verrucomicrobiae bacterium]|nr:hypothetical protein [Verrucomicrobiae bacterium]